ncbi:MAG: Rax2 family protein [Thermoflexus sp.]|nr:Rax2 family protein [Thermoflexus sp.]
MGTADRSSLAAPARGCVRLEGLPISSPAYPSSETPAAPVLSPEALLNPDGTLRLAPDVSGLLDLEGWSVQLDPERGPVLRPQGASTSSSSSSGGWHNLGGGLYGALNSTVYAIAVSGTNVYVGGTFTDAGGNLNADFIARWDASTNTWHPLGNGLNGPVHAITVSGTNVYVGGWFTDAGGHPNADYIARWDGNTWHPLGTGVNGPVLAIAASGTNVYVGGSFTDAGGHPNADRIARWDGTTWRPLDTGLNSVVHAIAVGGRNVYVGGRFTDAGGDPFADYIARWLEPWRLYLPLVLRNHAP